jgi:hypothetical protein
MMGYGSGPAAIDGVFGFEAYGEFGTPLWHTLFRHGDLYAGAAVAMPIHLGSPRHVTDLNNSTWVMTRRFEFVPMVRTRTHLDHPGGGDATAETDVEAGLTFRLRVFSDLF